MSRFKRFLLVLADVVVITVVFYLSFLLRFEFQIPAKFFTPLVFFKMLAVALFLRLLVFFYMGFYHRLWNYASIGELKAVINGVTISSLLIGFIFYFDKTMIFPRSVILIDWALSILFIGGIRFLWRLLSERRLRIFGGCSQRGEREKTQKKTKVLIVGAGDAGDLVIRELLKHRELHYEIVGIIDDDPLKKNMVLHGCRVLGDRQKIKDIIPKYGVEEVIIAIPAASGNVIRALNSICRQFNNVKVKTLPGVYELIDGKFVFGQLREVRVEDLLRREPIELDTNRIAEYLKDKVVLVTGGGGSIGSELVRQISRFKPQKIIIFDVAENSVFYIHREMKDRLAGGENGEIIPIVGSIQDYPKVNGVFQQYRPHVVFHAAAYKHVPLMEFNPEEAIKNNVFGTYNVVEAAHTAGVKRFVLISTDKAVKPGNIMGATKRIAEMVIQAKNKISDTEFVAVRFGNVLGSDGSVIPCFQEQIKKGVPLTLTHKDITRYFMTIPEAVQLVMQAGAIARGGEIFILDMGNPVKILDLAKDLIRLNGLEPHMDVPIEYIGLRPGEKMTEELVRPEEKIERTVHGKIMVIRESQIDYAKMVKQIRELETTILKSPHEVRRNIEKIVPDFIAAEDLIRKTGV